MTEKKKEDFVVTDKRKFTVEGDLRPDVATEEQESTVNPVAAPPPARPAEPKPASPLPAAPADASAQPDFPPVPPPPSAAEQQVKHDAYRESGKQFEPSRLSGASPRDYEMSFERLVASLYMTAMMQLGVMHEEGEQPMADLIGAKQSIDTLGILQEKTKGNLTDAEQNLLQNVLYELRMAFVELTNAIARGAQGRPAPGGEK
jgi:hypothetical protein